MHGWQVRANPIMELLLLLVGAVFRVKAFVALDPPGT